MQTLPASVIDYGCGSGVLAVAALLLGTQEVQCVDIDPQALTATVSNAEVNGVESNIRVSQKPAELEPAELVLANILAGPLTELAPQLAELTKPGGTIVLSGILETQAEELLQTYSAWFDMQPVATMEDWRRDCWERDAHHDAATERNAGQLSSAVHPLHALHDATLRLRAASLRAAVGHVRCGSCYNVFNALVHLDDVAPVPLDDGDDWGTDTRFELVEPDEPTSTGDVPDDRPDASRIYRERRVGTKRNATRSLGGTGSSDRSSTDSRISSRR